MNQQDNKDLIQTWEELAKAIDDLNNSGHMSNDEIAIKYGLIKRLNRKYDTIANRIVQNTFRLPQAQKKPVNFLYMILGAWAVAFLILMTVALVLG